MWCSERQRRVIPQPRPTPNGLGPRGLINTGLKGRDKIMSPCHSLGLI